MLNVQASTDIDLPSAAVSSATAGWPVIPLWPQRKQRRTRKGTDPSVDLRQVRRWWARWPDANVGLVITGLPVVLFDPDGPLGEESLRQLLEAAGCPGLPSTFTVTTGREDGGRHLYFRLPKGAAKLVNQQGREDGPSPSLDIIFNGLGVAPGSIHKSGRTYTATSTMPSPEALAVLPEEVYDYLLARGRVRGAPRPRSSRARQAETPRVEGDAQLIVRASKRVQRELRNGGDGANGRTMRVVACLVNSGWDDASIVAVIWGSPLGRKAREQHDGQAWITDKVNCARQTPVQYFDKQAWLRDAFTSGVNAGAVRLADVMAMRSTPSGKITRSLVLLGIDAALSSAAQAIQRLIHAGLVVVEQPGSDEHAATYRLVRSDEKRHPHIGAAAPTTTPPHCGLGVPFSVLLPGHDAWRCQAGSLNTAYPLFRVLQGRPLEIVEVARWLDTTERAVRDQIRILKRAGIARVEHDQISLTTGSLPALLRQAAHAAGTYGARERALRAYRERSGAWSARRAEAERVGSPVWRDLSRAYYRRQIERWEPSPLLDLFDNDIAALAEHLRVLEERSHLGVEQLS